MNPEELAQAKAQLIENARAELARAPMAIQVDLLITEKQINQFLRPLARKLYIHAQEFGEAACPLELWLDGLKDDLVILLLKGRERAQK